MPHQKTKHRNLHLQESKKLVVIRDEELEEAREELSLICVCKDFAGFGESHVTPVWQLYHDKRSRERCLSGTASFRQLFPEGCSAFRDALARSSRD